MRFFRPSHIREQLRNVLLAGVGWMYLFYAWAIDAPGGSGIGVPGLIVCPVRLLAGIDCPLCGTTRSWHAALHGEWATAFAQHPVMPLLLPAAILVTAALSVSPLASWRGVDTRG